jgi:hypothetical protein
MRLSFAHVEQVLALAHEIRDDKRAAFAARLKHLQRLGFPPGVNTGRGVAATYDIGHLFLLGLALELNQLGLTPERAADVLMNNPEAVLSALSIASAWRREGTEAGPMLLYFDPAVMSPLMRPPEEEDQASASFFYGGWAVVRENIDSKPWHTRRIALVNVSDVVFELIARLVVNLKLGDEGEWLDNLDAWIDSCRDGKADYGRNPEA